MVQPAFGVLAHKMWAGAVAGPSYGDFTERSAMVARWPGSILLKLPPVGGRTVEAGGVEARGHDTSATFHEGHDKHG